MKKEFNDTESIEDVLRSLIEEHGKDLYKKENTFRLKSFLSDFAVKFPKERKFLNVVLDEGIQEKLLSIDNGSNDDKHYVVASCCLRLTEDIGFSENRATEALKILTAGLGWEDPFSTFVEERCEQKQELAPTPAIEVSDSLGKTSPLENQDNKYDIQKSSLNVNFILSPIDGTIYRYLVKESSDVSPDTKILTVMSNMMELEIKAGYSGKVHFIKPICSRTSIGQPIARIEKCNLLDENINNQPVSKPIISNKIDNKTQTNNQWQNTQQQSKKKSVNKSRKFYAIGIVILAIIFLAIGILKNRVNITHTNGVTNVSLNTQKLPYIEVGKDEKFKTLKKAILFIEEGGTIVLKPGVYTGSININKKLKLVGIKEDIKTKATSELPIIRGRCKVKAPAEIEGIAFKTSEGSCLLVKSDSRIKNITILRSGHDGIVFTTKNATLENARISNCKNFGIRCSGKAEPSIINTQINKTNQVGIVLEDNSNSILTNCSINGSNGYGLVIKNKSSGNFSNCFVNNSGYSGIVIKSSEKSVFINCDISNNGGNGAKIGGSTTSEFKNCKIYDNKNGILIHNKANPILTDCKIYLNKKYGIWVKNYANNMYPSCVIYGNALQNIFQKTSSPSQIETQSSTIKNNKNTVVVSQEPRTTILKADPGETFSVAKYVQTDGLNVRSGPGENYNSIFTVTKNSLVYVSDTSKSGVWVKIKYNNKIGWVNKTFLSDFVIKSVHVGNHDDDGDWITKPGEILFASKVMHLGIIIDVLTINGYNKNTTFHIKIITPDNKYIQGNNVPIGYTVVWPCKLKNGYYVIPTFNISRKYYKKQPGKWLIQIFYQNPENDNTFDCIAEKKFIIH